MQTATFRSDSLRREVVIGNLEIQLVAFLSPSASMFAPTLSQRDLTIVRMPLGLLPRLPMVPQPCVGQRLNEGPGNSLERQMFMCKSKIISPSQ
jgi:hypothetical protein